jgi:translation initiation factor IF-2
LPYLERLRDFLAAWAYSEDVQRVDRMLRLLAKKPWKRGNRSASREKEEALARVAALREIDRLNRRASELMELMETYRPGRAVVRQTFKISRVGTVAGCYVTQGVIERSARVRVIREGIVVYPPTDQTVGLESLRRFYQDAREVRAGFECGLKIAGYDDLQVGDVIEAYHTEQGRLAR